MLRISILIAALVFVETTSIGVSSAQAVVCSYDLCVSRTVIGPATNVVLEAAIDGLRDACHRAFARGTAQVTCR
jgi:hypothetical protein